MAMVIGCVHHTTTQYTSIQEEQREPLMQTLQDTDGTYHEEQGETRVLRQ